MPVLVATATSVADVPVYLDGVGTAKALNTVTVRPQVDGKLLSVGFLEGQDVKTPATVIARIDPVTYQAQLDQALGKKGRDQAQLTNAKLDSRAAAEARRHQRHSASSRPTPSSRWSTSSKPR